MKRTFYRKIIWTKSNLTEKSIKWEVIWSLKERSFNRKVIWPKRSFKQNGHMTGSFDINFFYQKSNDVFHAKPNSNWFGCNNFFDAMRTKIYKPWRLAASKIFGCNNFFNARRPFKFCNNVGWNYFFDTGRCQAASIKLLQPKQFQFCFARNTSLDFRSNDLFR
jgi:hypothetical protein